MSDGPTTEPQIIAIHNGPKVIFNSTSLKSFNEDLNSLEVFAYVHDEVEKLSGQLLLDVANRLPGALKRQYLDCLEQRGLNLNRPGFESLRKFVLRELNVMAPDYAQTFFKADEKEKSCDAGGGTRGAVCVRQVAVKTEDSPSSLTNAQESETRNDSPRGRRATETKPPPCVFSVATSQDIFSGTAKSLKTFLTNAGRRL